MQNGTDATPDLVLQKSSGPGSASCDANMVGGGGCFSSNNSDARARKTYFRPSLTSSTPITSTDNLETSSSFDLSLVLSLWSIAMLILPSIVPPPTKSGAFRSVDSCSRRWAMLPCSSSFNGGLGRIKVRDGEGRRASDGIAPFATDRLTGD